MSRRAARWVGFLGLFAVAPLPMLFFTDALVPAARYLLLAVVSLAVVLSEGAAGATVGITVVFIAHAAGYAVLCWGVASGLARVIVSLPEPLGAVLLWGGLALGIAIGLHFEIYRTPFGRAPWGTLWDAWS